MAVQADRYPGLTVAGLYGRDPGAATAGQADADPLLADRAL
ncbi:hypothetical protein [Microbispora sp. NBC_01389]